MADKPEANSQNEADTQPAQSRQALSLEATQPAPKPGDHLETVKPASDNSQVHSRPLGDATQTLPASTEKYLPELQITSDGTVRGSARELDRALSKTTLGIASPDGKSVLTSLASLSDGERTKLEALYKSELGPERDLRRDLQKLSASDQHRALALLDKKDGKTDDAAHLQAALTERDPQKRDGQIRLLYRTLNPEQIQTMESRFSERGGSLEQAMKTAGVPESTLSAVETYKRAAGENRPVSGEELSQLARLGARSGNRDLIIEAVAGTTPEAKQAREMLKDDRAFNAGILRNFKDRAPATNLTEAELKDPTNRVDPVLRDYLQEGRVRLSTVAEANSGYFFGNRGNTDLAVKHASADERQAYKQGYELDRRLKDSGEDGSKLSPEEQKSLGFYRNLEASLQKAGNRGDTIRWQDTLLNGRETVVSQLGKTEKDGLLWGSSHSTADALTAAGKLSEKDWRTLRNAEHGQTPAEKEEGAAFKRQVEESVARFASEPKEAARIMGILSEKANKENYSEAQKVGLSLDETLSDARGGNHKQQLADSLKAITAMTPEQARQYKEDAQLRKQVDDELAKGPAEVRPLSQRLLKQVAESGEPPVLKGFDKIENSALSGKPLTIKETQELLREPEVAKRLGRSDIDLTPAEKRASLTLDSAIYNGLSARLLNERPQLLSEAQPGDSRSLLLQAGAIRRQLAQNGGQLSLEQQYKLNLPMQDVLGNLAAAPKAERERFLKEVSTNPQFQDLAANVAKQGEVRLEDRARLYSLDGKDSKELAEALGQASPQELADASAGWAWKFKGDLATTVLNRAGDGEKPALKAALTPAGDGRAGLYENYEKYVSNRAFTLDGTALTLERAGQLHQEAFKAYDQARQGLPPAKQKELDEFFGKSLQDHKDSKEKQTQILLDAAITAATLGSGAPVSVARVAARIAAGGLTESAGLALSRGEFKAENFAQDFLQGGLAAYAGKTARAAGDRVASSLEHPKLTGAAPTKLADEAAEIGAPRPQPGEVKVKTEEITVKSGEAKGNTGAAEAAPKTTQIETPAHTTRIEKEAAELDLSRSLEAKALQSALPVKIEGASKDFAEKVGRSVESLPPEIAEKLKKEGISIEVVGNIHNYTTDQAYLSTPVRGQPGKTQADSVGFFDRANKKIILVENSLNGQAYWPGDTVQRAVSHELGHAVDSYTVGDVLKSKAFERSAQPGRPLIGRQISDLPEFQKAVYADLQELSKTLAAATPEERQAIGKIVEYNLANSGHELKKLGLDGIGTHFDNPRLHDQNGIRHFSGRHSDARSEAFADVHSDLLYGDDRFTRYFPNVTRLIRDDVLELPGASLDQVTGESLQKLGLKPIAQHGERLWLESADKKSFAAINEGKLVRMKVGGNDYELGYNSQGQLARIETNGRHYEMIDGTWHKVTAVGSEKLPQAPVLIRLGNGRLQFFER